MSFAIFFSIFAWVVSWFFVLGIPNFWKEEYGFKYWKNPIIFSSWFLFFSSLEIGYLNIFYPNSFYIISNLNPFFEILFVIFFIILFFLNSYSYKFLHPKEKFENGIHYSWSKGAEILAQQILILIVINIFKDFNFLVEQIIFIMPFLFLLVHLPLYFFINKKLANILIFSSIGGSIVFSYLYLFLDFGLLQTYLVHFSFYVLLNFYYYFFVSDKKLLKQIDD